MSLGPQALGFFSATGCSLPLALAEYQAYLPNSFSSSPKQYGSCWGRGKLGDHRLAQVPVKGVWVYPLAKDFRDRLAQ